MGHFDLPLEQLRDYAPELCEPADLEAFWAQTLDEAAGHDLDPVFAPYDSPLRTVEVLDVSFAGFGGQRVAAWLLLPRHRAAPLPCVVEYVGYGGRRGPPPGPASRSGKGYPAQGVDPRGGGRRWRPRATPGLDPPGRRPPLPRLPTP